MHRLFATCAAFALTLPAAAQSADLAAYFGFSGLEVIKIGRDAGPLISADMNGDGHADLIVVNNFASRIEIHYHKPGASPDDELTAAPRINEFPEHWRFRRENISVTHRIMGIVATDFDRDGRMDLIYGGIPQEIVILRQEADGVFSSVRRHRVRNLNANRNALSVANVIGDDRPEVITVVNEDLALWTLEGDPPTLRNPLTFASGGQIAAFHVADYNGDRLPDIGAVIPDDPAPLRIWFGGGAQGNLSLGAQHRFEMPALREFKPVNLPGRDDTLLAVIERASKRIVVHEVSTATVSATGDRDAPINVYGFTDAGNRTRDLAVADFDGDGLLDLMATDTEANALVLFRQLAGKGLQSGESFPTLAEVTAIVAADVDDDPYAELFVLSEEEGVVGRSDVSPEGVPFPLPLNLPDGTTPVALNVVTLDDQPRVTVICKKDRDYSVEIIDMAGQRQSVELGQLSRAPDTILGLDADQDARTDLLLFTRDRPMTLLHAGEDGFNLTESDDMGQYGLVQAARADNTLPFDIDGDGHDELLIADSNFVRAVRYEPTPPPQSGVSPGWQVVRQINVHDSSSKLVSLALIGDRIIAADSENTRLVVMGKQPPSAPGSAGGSHPESKAAENERRPPASGVGGRPPASGVEGRPPSSDWSELESLYIRGFELNAIIAGSFSGDGMSNLLAVGDDGFAIVKLAGERIALEELAVYRTDDERRAEHELITGDLNHDDYTDLAALDAGEQMCEILTFSESHRLLYATGFQIFESKIFSGGAPREFEPSQGLITDVTGDGANDLILLAHDRILLYPQMTRDQ